MAHAHRRTFHPLLALAVVAVAGFGLAACGDDEEGSTTSTTAETTTTVADEGAEAEELSVSDPWVRPVMDLAAMNRPAVYLQITGGAEADALLSASVPAAAPSCSTAFGWTTSSASTGRSSAKGTAARTSSRPTSPISAPRVSG